MSTEMTFLGEMLKKAREEKHVSLKEAENLISIRAGYLQAIEEGKINEFISGVYALGFLKQYANFLDFNLDKLMQEYPNAFQFHAKPHDFSYGIGTLEVRGSLGGGIKWLPNLLWTAGAALVIILAYYFSKALGLL